MSGNQRAAAGFQSLGSIFGDLPEPKQRGLVVEANLSELHPFKNHPFQVRDDESMQELVDSIKANGVLYPAIVRPRQEGGYEIIAGYRRHHACKQAGLSTVPIDIRNVDDATATIMMVNTNFQREKVLASEKAFAYKMMLEAIKHQGKHGSLTSAQLGPKQSATSADTIGTKVNESRNQIKRYIRLTELLSCLLEMVDNGALPFNTGVELSYLGKQEQQCVADIMISKSIKPSMSQATQLKEIYQKDGLTAAIVEGVLGQNGKAPVKISFLEKELTCYFPSDYTPNQMQEVILNLLKEWAQSQGKIANVS